MANDPMTQERLEAMTEEERHAWMASLDDVEVKVLHCPKGWRHMLLMVSVAKWALVKSPMPVDLRLRFLEVLKKFGDIGNAGSTFNSAALAAVKPADDTSAEIIQEAMKLDKLPHELGDDPSLTVLTRWEVFLNLTRLNPSLLAAIDLCGFPRAAQRGLL